MNVNTVFYLVAPEICYARSLCNYPRISVFNPLPSRSVDYFCCDIKSVQICESFVLYPSLLDLLIFHLHIHVCALNIVIFSAKVLKNDTLRSRGKKG